MNEEQIRKAVMLKKQGKTYQEIATEMNLTTNVVYRWVKLSSVKGLNERDIRRLLAENKLLKSQLSQVKKIIEKFSIVK